MTQDIILQDQRILIVDDNKSNILVIKLVLQEHNVGFIYEATSAKEAYEILAKESIDAILLDVTMPDIDGIQACQELRKNPKYDLIPILMVTAHKDKDILKKSFDAGANDFLEKPINEIALMGRLNSQLKQRLMEKSIIKSARFSAKDEMIAMLSHQWRQPLSNITVLSSTIKTMIELDSFNEQETLKSLSSIENAVQSLSELLSSFSMAFTSQREKQDTDINGVFENLIILMQPIMSEHNITLNRKGHISDNISIDNQSLLQVLINIMTNSVEALDRSGIAAPTIQLELSESSEKITIRIIDNGKGIKEEDFPFIFEPYFTTKQERNGKGLGLYIVNQLVSNNLNGTITLRRHKHLTLATLILPIERLTTERDI